MPFASSITTPSRSRSSPKTSPTAYPILANCTSEELIHEIVDCGPLIEKHLLKPVDFFCYPNGDFNPLVTRFVEKSYKAATITRSKDLKTKLTSAGVPEEKIHAN